MVTLEEDGGRTDGVVRDWIDGGVLIEPGDLSLGGGGLFSRDDVTFLDERGAVPGTG